MYFFDIELIGSPESISYSFSQQINLKRKTCVAKYLLWTSSEWIWSNIIWLLWLLDMFPCVLEILSHREWYVTFAYFKQLVISLSIENILVKESFHQFSKELNLIFYTVLVMASRAFFVFHPLQWALVFNISLFSKILCAYIYYCGSRMVNSLLFLWIVTFY